MKFYLIKCLIVKDGKSKKENYVCKADSSISAETTTSVNLAHKDLQEVPDINKKNWVDIVINPDGGWYYDVSIEWDSVEGKTIKESYLIQALDIHSAITITEEQSAMCEITSIKKTQILDYFIQEEEV